MKKILALCLLAVAFGIFAPLADADVKESKTAAIVVVHHKHKKKISHHPKRHHHRRKIIVH